MDCPILSIDDGRLGQELLLFLRSSQLPLEDPVLHTNPLDIPPQTHRGELGVLATSLLRDFSN